MAKDIVYRVSYNFDTVPVDDSWVDRLRTKITSTLTTHTELNNPYFLNDDADLMFDQAWALSIGPGENTNREFCNKLTVSRDFIITLTQRFYAPSRDITARLTAEKTIFNYQLDLLAGLCDYTTADIIKVSYVSDNGTEYLDGDRIGFLVLQTLVNVEYFENC